MSDFINERAKVLHQGMIRAFFDKAKGYENIINMGIGEPDGGTPKPIIEASYRAMLDGKTHYTANAGDIEVRRQVSKYAARYGIEADPIDEIILTIGGMGALALTLLCTVSPGDEVLIQDPQWLNYISQVRFAGGVPVPVPAYEENRFSITANDIEAKITAKTKILMLNSPNNPTGAVLSLKELEEIAHVARKHDLLVLSDEVYCEMLYDGLTHHSIASLPGMKERTIVINSCSKSFAMTGWRIGFAAGPKEIIKKMVVLQENLMACAPLPAQMAAKYAMETMCEVDNVKTLYAQRRDLILELLNEIDGVTCLKPTGAFYVFPNIKSFENTSEHIATQILEQTQVVTIPGSAFGQSGEGYLRVAYANSEENIIEGVRRIKMCLDNLR